MEGKAIRKRILQPNTSASALKSLNNPLLFGAGSVSLAPIIQSPTNPTKECDESLSSLRKAIPLRDGRWRERSALLVLHATGDSRVSTCCCRRRWQRLLLSGLSAEDRATGRRRVAMTRAASGCGAAADGSTREIRQHHLELWFVIGGEALQPVGIAG